MKIIRSASVLAAGLLLSLLAPDTHAAGIDWKSVPGKEIVLFYPGQSSWEWALTPADMSGADDFRKGTKNCDACHIGEEKTMGPQIVTGAPRVFKTGEKPSIEPTPIAGKPGFFPATVKFANDGTSLFVHLEFAEGAQPDAKQDAAFATKVTVMFNDGKVSEANRGGCFAACHDDAAGMASAGGATRTKYLPKTRAKLTRQGGGDALKPADDLAKLKADGYFLEYWQARLNPGKPAEAANGAIFDKREQTSPTVVTAEATQSGGTWAVTLSRKLDAGAAFKSFSGPGPYYVAVAIHSGHTAHRFHYVSFERTLAINSGNADFVAVKK
jgi:cytochrome c-type protein NapC